MSLATWFTRRTVARQISSWGLEIARQCHHDVAVRLSGPMYSMSLPEARGYVRARAASAVDSEVARFVHRTACEPALAPILRERAVEEVVRLSIGDLLRASRQSALRKAA